jgi:hypothetical protein
VSEASRLSEQFESHMQAFRARGIKAWYPVRTIMGPIQNCNLHLLDQHELHVDDLIAAGDLDHEPSLFRIRRIKHCGTTLVTWYALEAIDHVPQ